MKKLFIILIILLAPALVGATYYVKPYADGGRDTNDGQSDATAWATVAKVNSTTFATGDDVYFKCGGTWSNDKLIIDWGGTSGDRAIVGAYYGSGTIGVSGDKPIFEGTMHTVVGGEITVEGYPSQYTSLISVRNNYVTATNLKIINSGGTFIEASGQTYTADHTKFINIDGDTSDDAGIVANSCDDIEVTGCDVTNNGYGRVVQGISGAWGAAIALVNTTNTHIHKNIVHENYGEGINHNSGSVTGIVENNLVYGNRAAQVYLDGASYITVRHNLIYGTSDTTYHRSVGYCGAGIWIADEQANGYHASTSNVIYGNFIANCYAGFYTGLYIEFEDTVFVNNTLVGNNHAIRMYYNTVTNSIIKNNIFSLSGGSSLYYGATMGSGLTWDYNNWSSAVSAWQTGANDVIGDPDLYKTSGWQSLTAGSLDESDFGLTSESPCINTGVDLGDDYDSLLDVLQTSLPSTVVEMDQDDFGSGWEIGAAPYKGGITLSGTLIPIGSASELDIRNGSKTIIITLLNGIWDATAGDDNSITTGIINGIDGDLTTDSAWDSIVKAGLDYTMITRTSDTILTITLPAFSEYDILQTETISIIIPADATTIGIELSASVFYISAIDEVVEGKRMLAPSNENGKQIFYSATGSMILQPQ